MGGRFCSTGCDVLSEASQIGRRADHPGKERIGAADDVMLLMIPVPHFIPSTRALSKDPPSIPLSSSLYRRTRKLIERPDVKPSGMSGRKRGFPSDYFFPMLKRRLIPQFLFSETAPLISRNRSSHFICATHDFTILLHWLQNGCW